MPGDCDGEIWTIVVAGGAGRRFGGAKQFEVIGGRRVLDHSVAAAASTSNGVVVVTSPDTMVEGADRVVAGGSTRAESVRCGLAAVPESADVIVVHDAARPLADPELFRRTVAAVRNGAAGAIPVVPLTDSLRSLGGGPVDRGLFVAVQTPQAFRADALRGAHHGSPEATDDASLVEAAGHAVVFVDGDRWNLKITERSDLVVAAALLGARS